MEECLHILYGSLIFFVLFLFLFHFFFGRAQDRHIKCEYIKYIFYVHTAFVDAPNVIIVVFQLICICIPYTRFHKHRALTFHRTEMKYVYL